MFFKIGVLKNFAIFTGNHLCWNNFIKKRLQLRFFAMNIGHGVKVGPGPRDLGPWDLGILGPGTSLKVQKWDGDYLKD